MVSYTITVKANKMPALLGLLDTIEDALADRVADQGVSEVQSRAPVRSGKLRASYHKEAQGHGQRTVTNDQDAYYALFVELGTRHMAAQPHVIPAALALEAYVGGVFTALVEAALG